jgi:hypothetical protein
MASYPHQVKRQGSRPSPRSPGTGKNKNSNHNVGVKRSLKAARQAEAKARKAEYDNLLPQQKLQNLDKVLGKGQGAARERAKLQKQLGTENEAQEAAATAKKSKK